MANRLLMNVDEVIEELGVSRTFAYKLIQKLNKELEILGEEYGVSPATLASAWILRHPAGMQLIAGTMDEGHLKEIAAAADVKLSREHWYRLYLAAGYSMP